MTNILFICKHNRFRSKVAEAVFNKLNKNKKIKAKSAGIIIGSPVSKIVISISKKKGYKISGKPQGLSTDLLKWADIYVIVADNVPREIFGNVTKYRKKLILWKIRDASEYNKKDIARAVNMIEGKIKKFVKELNN
ncbi:hypothetical protein HYW74_03720 [Candidatus Pacearchaeota archaeon]|nr:hypothetical protein [Candidatus Pacearchaeota archaeon]